MTYEDSQGSFRRKYPRRKFQRRVSVLHQGRYFLADSEEIGEGGMALLLSESLKENDQLVVNFRIPSGDFVSLRAEVRSVRAGDGGFHHGIAFRDIVFTHKRQIRTYVSARTSREKLLI
ncbi:MAG: PilZ domain-containing protein [Bdellovibrionaceae bacterium]|nr:PilZ domain-containing protein [Pseudobdellovibrionaceae bacterium]